MFGKNVDIIAVFFIAVTMLGFSKAASLRVPLVMDSIQMQKAVSNGSFRFESFGKDSCPIRDEFLSRLEDILNQ